MKSKYIESRQSQNQQDKISETDIVMADITKDVQIPQPEFDLNMMGDSSSSADKLEQQDSDHSMLIEEIQSNHPLEEHTEPEKQKSAGKISYTKNDESDQIALE